MSHTGEAFTVRATGKLTNVKMAKLAPYAPARDIACWQGAAAVAQPRAVLEEAGAADNATPEEAVRAIAQHAT